ncbi:hypothetical protein EPUS_05447 [Endocarpon pusillum Z07020]|uniref:Uncharacterized protein n=1 Tax=Endocarpon pusillum (strain Z07020 / HMAS-L-300199) TaxID=1263415 RepID=U1GCW8_ENDPU|nr:uncharacterized protein EPUS_05447 [Endocarpon pusillum Z07020]ERF69903.1 hypothetical protein EPUS_05447 [Endocarpon pusillum Z07020]
MKTAKAKRMTTGKKSELNCNFTSESSQAYDFDGPVMYWMKKLDDYRQKNKTMIFGISWEYLDFMVRMFLATHLASSKVIGDCRNGLPGDQLKLIPTSPNHPSRKFRVIQLWDKGTRSTAARATTSDKTVLTPFITRDLRTSNRRRWPSRRASPLKVDLVEEARNVYELYLKTLEEVRQYRAQRPVWECGEDDGLDPLPGETMEEYCARVRPRLHQKW